MQVSLETIFHSFSDRRSNNSENRSSLFLWHLIILSHDPLIFRLSLLRSADDTTVLNVNSPCINSISMSLLFFGNDVEALIDSSHRTGLSDDNSCQSSIPDMAMF